MAESSGANSEQPDTETALLINYLVLPCELWSSDDVLGYKKCCPLGWGAHIFV